MAFMTYHQSMCKKCIPNMFSGILIPRAKQMKKKEVQHQSDQKLVERVTRGDWGLSLWKLMVMVGILVLTFALPKVSAEVFVAPNVVGFTQVIAETAITNVGLKVGAVTTAN
ncbi:MAG: hypothetical protein V3T42_12545, partial [Nitrospirales bacterium]